MNDDNGNSPEFPLSRKAVPAFPPSRLPAISVLSLALTGVSVLGCSDAPATSASPPASAHASTVPSAVDLSSYCAQICKRTTACGVEALSKTVKGDPVEIAVLSRARAAASATERGCTEGCAASKPEQPAELAKASYCLEQASCDALESCLSTAAGESQAAAR